jgi:hypothetical protein
MSTLFLLRSCASLVTAGSVLVAIVCFLVDASKVEGLFHSVYPVRGFDDHLC